MNIEKIIQAVDLHACGEPGRVIVGGVTEIPGETMFEKMQYLSTKGDRLRKLMLNEPRGYPASNCNLILPSAHPDAVYGYVIMEHVEYPGMSGTNTICVTTAILETGLVPMEEPVTEMILEAPAGLIKVRADCKNGKVKKVTFKNVPSFATHLDAKIEVPHLGKVTVDVAYGGMFYVIADATPFGLKLTAAEGGEIVRIGEMIKTAAREQLPVVHPLQPGFDGITIGQLTAAPANPSSHGRNAVIVSTGNLDWKKPTTWKGAIDRSPCGTGTSARMATLFARGKLGLNQDFIHEGILGTTFTGQLIEVTQVGPYKAVVPTISGSAWITGFSQYVVDGDDPFQEGYTVGDIW
jgi:proline racemase